MSLFNILRPSWDLTWLNWFDMGGAKIRHCDCHWVFQMERCTLQHLGGGGEGWRKSGGTLLPFCASIRFLGAPAKGPPTVWSHTLSQQTDCLHILNLFTEQFAIFHPLSLKILSSQPELQTCVQFILYISKSEFRTTLYIVQFVAVSCRSNPWPNAKSWNLFGPPPGIEPGSFRLAAIHSNHKTIRDKLSKVK